MKRQWSNHPLTLSRKAISRTASSLLSRTLSIVEPGPSLVAEPVPDAPTGADEPVVETDEVQAELKHSRASTEGDRATRAKRGGSRTSRPFSTHTASARGHRE